jgi:hypothetical protein
MNTQYSDAKTRAFNKVQEMLEKPDYFEKFKTEPSTVNGGSSVKPFVLIKNSSGPYGDQTIESVYPIFMFPSVCLGKGFPILILTKEFFKNINGMENVFIAQKHGLGKIIVYYNWSDSNTWNNEKDYMDIFVDFVPTMQESGYQGSTKHILLITLKIKKYFYSVPEALFWNWYGGNIPVDGSTREIMYSDDRNGNGNGWRNYAHLPNYYDVKGILYQSREELEKNITLLHTYESNYAQLGIEIKNNKKITDQQFTRTILDFTQSHPVTIALNTMDGLYYMITDILKMLGIDPNNISNKSRYYTKYSIKKLTDEYMAAVLDHEIYSSDRIDKISDIYTDYKMTYEDFRAMISALSAELILARPKNWLTDFGSEDQFIKLVTEISESVTSKFSPTEKLNEQRRMTNVFMRIFEIAHENPGLFGEFNIPGIAGKAKEKFEQDVEHGTVTGDFTEYLKKEFRLLPETENRRQLLLKL